MQRYNPLPCLLKTVPSVSGRFLTLLFKIYVVKVNNKLILNRLWDHENNNKYGLLNTCEIKVAGYCLFCVFMDPDGVVVHEQAKKERTRISSHLDRTSLVSNIELVIWYKEQFFFPAGHSTRSQANAILPNRVCNHSVAFGSCYLLSVLGI